jgi:hypothetical protein
MSRSELEVINWTWFTLGQRSKTIVSAANRRCYVLEYNMDDDSKGAFQAHEGAVTGLSINMDTATIITAGRSDLHLWDLHSCESINHLRDIDADPVTAMLDFPSAASVVVGTSGGALKLYSTASFAVQAIWLHQSQARIDTLVDLGDNTFAAIGGALRRCEIVRFDAKALTLFGSPMERRGAPIEATATCTFASGGPGYIVVGEVGNIATVWKRSVKAPCGYEEVLRAQNFQTEARMTAIAAFPSCSAFITGDSAGWLNIFATDQDHIWRLERAQLPRPPNVSVSPAVTVMCLFHTDQHVLLAVGDDYGQSVIFDPTPALGKRNALLREPRNDLIPGQANVRLEASAPVRLSQAETHPEAAVTCMRVLPGVDLIASGGTDCRVQLSTLSGVHVGYYLMAKVGDVVDERRPGAVPSKNYNDLPPPYGTGSKETTSVSDVLGTINLDAPDPIAQGAGRPSVHQQPHVVDALNATTRSLRRKYRPMRQRQATIEQPPTLLLPSGEVLYHVPQYIDVEGAEDGRHPTELARSLYGTSSDFKATNHRLLLDASRLERATLPHLAPRPAATSQSASPSSPVGGASVGSPTVFSATRSVPQPAASHGSPVSRTPEPRRTAIPASSQVKPVGRLRPIQHVVEPPKPKTEFFVPSVRALVGDGNRQAWSHSAWRPARGL